MNNIDDKIISNHILFSKVMLFHNTALLRILNKRLERILKEEEAIGEDLLNLQNTKRY